MLNCSYLTANTSVRCFNISYVTQKISTLHFSPVQSIEPLGHYKIIYPKIFFCK